MNRGWTIALTVVLVLPMLAQVLMWCGLDIPAPILGLLALIELAFGLFLAVDFLTGKPDSSPLQTASKDADSTLKANREFLASMSHELRTPLNGVLGMTEVVLDTDLTPEQREYLRMVQSSAESLLRLVNDILDLSKGDAGKLVLEPIEFSLREMLSESLNPLAIRAQGKGLELAYHVQPRVPDGLIGDVHRLKQVLINLAGNAIKFTETGEIVVRVALESRVADVARVQFSVADSGIGIPAEKHATIFEPFMQADASTTRKFGGTGLGLAITKQLVELMSGSVRVESEAGKGSTFIVSIPFHVGTGAGSKSRRTQLGLIPDLPVLLVDDNEASRSILEEMLRHWQTEPTSVASASAALAALDRSRSAGKPFGLVLLDSQLAGDDALGLCSSLRRSGTHGSTPVAMLVPANRPGDVAKALEVGAAATILKPVKQSKLARGIVAAVLGADKSLPTSIPADPDDMTEEIALPSLRLLLAEDNEINQKVARRLLEKGGHSVHLAATGREALAAFQSQVFDAILMDVQMPELDGFQTTAEIRKLEAGASRRIPIIAMTANAAEGDRDRCLAAGMDGYISKPIRSALLFAELRLLVPKRKSSPTSFDASELLARHDHNIEFLTEIQALLAEDGPALLKQTADAIRSDDHVRAAQLAHTLKGMIGNFSAPTALESIERLEIAAHKGQGSALSEELTVVERELGRLNTDLKAFIAGLRRA